MKVDVTMISASSHFNFTPLLASCAVGTLEFRCVVEPVSMPHNILECVMLTTLLGTKIRSSDRECYAFP